MAPIAFGDMGAAISHTGGDRLLRATVQIPPAPNLPPPPSLNPARSLRTLGEALRVIGDTLLTLGDPVVQGTPIPPPISTTLSIDTSSAQRRNLFDAEIQAPFSRLLSVAQQQDGHGPGPAVHVGGQAGKAQVLRGVRAQHTHVVVNDEQASPPVLAQGPAGRDAVRVEARHVAVEQVPSTPDLAQGPACHNGHVTEHDTRNTRVVVDNEQASPPVLAQGPAGHDVVRVAHRHVVVEQVASTPARAHEPAYQMHLLLNMTLVQ